MEKTADIKQNVFNKLGFFLILATVFALPLFFLPLTLDFYVFNKTALLTIVTFLLLILFFAKSYQQRRFVIKKDPLLVPLLLLVVVYWLSAFVQSANKFMAITGTTTLITVFFFFYILTSNFLLKEKQVQAILRGIIFSSVIVSLLTIASFLELPKSLGFGPSWLQTNIWTPTGSPLNTLTFLAILLPICLIGAFKTKKPVEKIFLFSAAALKILSIIIILSLFFNKTVQLVYLSPSFGWQICVEGLKSLRTAFLGVGPEDFSIAFYAFRPVRLNLTPFWATGFNANSNFYFQLLSTVGIVGLVAYVWFMVKNLKNIKNNDPTVFILKLGLLVAFAVQIFLAGSILVLFFIFLASALLSSLNHHDRLEIQGIPFLTIITVLVGAGAVFSLYWQGRVWLGEYYFRQSLDAAQQNNGVKTYNLQIKAQALNPYNDSYRVTYSQTNFALANSLASKESLTDQDKENINQLVSQAVTEAKTAINLNQRKTINWVNLANLYRQLINFAQGADQWAVSAYIGAIQTNPTNPALRLELGSLFYALGNYDKAVEHFIKTIDLKPDWANAYYNLSAAYKEKGNYLAAFENMQNVVQLLPADSKDYSKVREELEQLKEMLPKDQKALLEEQEKEGELTTPSPLPSQNPELKTIELPEEVAPPSIPSPGGKETNK